MRLKNIPALLLILQLVLGSFTPFSPRTYARDMNDTADRADDAPDAPAPKGLRFRLSEGAEQSERAAPRPVAPATRLSEG